MQKNAAKSLALPSEPAVVGDTDALCREVVPPRKSNSWPRAKKNNLWPEDLEHMLLVLSGFGSPVYADRIKGFLTHCSGIRFFLTAWMSHFYVSGGRWLYNCCGVYSTSCAPSSKQPLSWPSWPSSVQKHECLGTTIYHHLPDLQYFWGNLPNSLIFTRFGAQDCRSIVGATKLFDHRNPFSGHDSDRSRGTGVSLSNREEQQLLKPLGSVPQFLFNFAITFWG